MTHIFTSLPLIRWLDGALAGWLVSARVYSAQHSSVCTDKQLPCRTAATIGGPGTLRATRR